MKGDLFDLKAIDRHTYQAGLCATCQAKNTREALRPEYQSKAEQQPKAESHTFTINGKRYSSLLDYLHVEHIGLLESVAKDEEDELRAAIDAYTEQMKQDQANGGVGAEDEELKAAVKIMSGLVEWGDNILMRDGMKPWEEARAFLATPRVRAMRQRMGLAVCKDHWHCDPLTAAHACDEPDRAQGCPTCKEPPDRDVFTETALAALKALVDVVPWPFAHVNERSARAFSPEATEAIGDAQAVLAEGRKKGLL